MASMKETRTNVYEISDDTLHPRSRKLIEPQAPLQPDGTILLYSKDTPIATESTLSLHNLGKTHAFENKSEPDNPFVFVNGGYSLTLNQETGLYSFTIFPQLDIDFDWLNHLSDIDRQNALVYISGMYPTVDITNSPNANDGMKVKVEIGPKKLSLISISGKETCEGNISNVDVYRREEMDRVQVLGVHAKNLRTSGLQGKLYYKPIAFADIPYPKPSISYVFDEYVTHAERELPERRDIMSLANARITLKSVDPFTQFKE